MIPYVAIVAICPTTADLSETVMLPTRLAKCKAVSIDLASHAIQTQPDFKPHEETIAWIGRYEDFLKRKQQTRQ